MSCELFTSMYFFIYNYTKTARSRDTSQVLAVFFYFLGAFIQHMLQSILFISSMN
jgi:hypothetical protein